MWKRLIIAIFYSLLKLSVRYINDLQNLLGRTWKAYQTDCAKEIRSISYVTPASATQMIGSSFEAATNALAEASAAEKQLQLAIGSQENKEGVASVQSSLVSHT